MRKDTVKNIERTERTQTQLKYNNKRNATRYRTNKEYRRSTFL